MRIYFHHTKWYRIHVYQQYHWLVVSTHLKNISQNGNLPQIGVKIKNLWNHHPDQLVEPLFLCASNSISIHHSTSASRQRERRCIFRRFCWTALLLMQLLMLSVAVANGCLFKLQTPEKMTFKRVRGSISHPKKASSSRLPIFYFHK